MLRGFELKILAEYGQENIAKVYVASFRDDFEHKVEFVESLQPPIPRDKKWVLIVSSSFGCPMKCLMCDAGGGYAGRLETEEIIAQIDYMVLRRFPDRRVPVKKFKVQFARVGEPSLNPCVLDAMELMPDRYSAPGLTACVSTIAPVGSDKFFDRLADLKNEHYSNGLFQLQFSIHSTQREKRDWLIPGRKWDLNRISEFGEKFYKKGDRKIVLNFALTKGISVDPIIINRYFDQKKFIIKLTPLNPTVRASENELASTLDPMDPHSAEEIVNDFHHFGFEVILSIGELEENKIGSNCGQFISSFSESELTIKGGYEISKYRLRPRDIS